MTLNQFKLNVMLQLPHFTLFVRPLTPLLSSILSNLLSSPFHSGFFLGLFHCVCGFKAEPRPVKTNGFAKDYDTMFDNNVR